MSKIKMILVGGFLGAGKTTLLGRAGNLLAKQGRRVGLITNDQAPGLVDTALLTRQGFGVDEVNGGCFCCHFNSLTSAWDRIIAQGRPEVIIGEPVGSCTDISATVAQPIKKFFGDRFDLAPLTVMTDPFRLSEALGDRSPTFPGDVTYIFKKQLEEADLVALNKTDLLSAPEKDRLKELLSEFLPGRPLMEMSAQTGQGVEDWLEYVLQSRPAGQNIIDIDYDVYAEGEAALGWLNAKIVWPTRRNVDWREAALSLVEDMRREIEVLGGEIAHLKIHLTLDDWSLQVNVTSSEDRPVIRTEGKISESIKEEAIVLVNARCHLDPENLKAVLERSLARAAGEGSPATIQALESFRPGRPQPTHRFAEVI